MSDWSQCCFLKSNGRDAIPKYITRPYLYVMHLQAMVAKFSSISTRKLSKAFSVITRDKTMVATSDYDDFHKMVKRYVLAGALGSSAQV
jgi:hypothetical protein